MSKKEFKTKNCKVSYEDSEEMRNAVFEKVMEFFKKHESFDGECIMQSDDPII